MLSSKIKLHISKLHQKKYRYEFSEFLIEGIKGVHEAMDADMDVLTVIVEGPRRDEKEFQALVHKAEQKGIAVEFCGRKDIGEIKTTDTFPGVMAVVGMPETGLDDFNFSETIICLDGVSDPGNLGTIIRTADWFGFDQLLLSENSVDPYNEKVVRSTMGSLFRTKIVRSEKLSEDLAWLKEAHGYTLAGLDLHGDDIRSMNNEKKRIFVFGSESHGIRSDIEKMLDKRYTISGSGRAESLNVAVAAAVTLYQLQS